MKAVYFAFVVLVLVACALADGGDVEPPEASSTATEPVTKPNPTTTEPITKPNPTTTEPPRPLTIHVPSICTHPADPGTLCSKPKSNRFSYNMGSHQCTEFMFNGCGGNPNNFDTLFECRKTCEIKNLI